MVSCELVSVTNNRRPSATYYESNALKVLASTEVAVCNCSSKTPFMCFFAYDGCPAIPLRGRSTNAITHTVLQR
eukprot:710043-Amphidinium_carterae.1